MYLDKKGLKNTLLNCKILKILDRPADPGAPRSTQALVDLFSILFFPLTMNENVNGAAVVLSASFFHEKQSR